MRQSILSLALLVVSVAVALGLGSRPAAACAVAPPESARVAIAGESAIIVWDEAKKTEHFLRRASFQAAPAHLSTFGFLVPTPSKPELAEGPDGAFADLDRAVQPERVYDRGYDFEATACAFFFLARKSAPASAGFETAAPPPVRVLEETQVAGFDAAILEADDPSALADWLKAHGYPTRPALAEWLAPYVTKKWKVTAFKVTPPPPSIASAAPTAYGFGSRTLRMSFATERPFFPYREPSDQREGDAANLAPSRFLRLFVLAPARVAGTIGDGSTAFRGKTTWAGPIDRVATGQLTSLLGARESWLTAIEDDASPRPGVDDLWLDRSKDAAKVRPPPIVIPARKTIPVPLDLALLSVVIVVLVVRRMRRRALA